MKVYWNNLKRQAEANPLVALAVITASLAAVTKLIGMTIEMRNSRAWALEVQRRAMKDLTRR